MTIGSIAAGWIGDRYGRRFSFQLNLLIFGLFSFAAAASPTMGWLTVSRFLMGLGMGAEFVIAYTMLSEFVPPKSRGRWQASMAVISNGAVFISSLCGFLIIPHYGWRWVFVIAGVAALAVWFLRKALPESPRWLESQGRTAEAEKVVDDIVHELGLKEAPAGVASWGAGAGPAPHSPSS
jgi:putative MFS transporter